MRTLIVDDEAKLRKMLDNFLTKQGHQVEMAENGQQGWEIFSEAPETFDMVLSDIKMPVMDGLELLEKIRRKDYDVPVVMMTGYAELGVTVKALKFGAFDFLLKPFDLNNLLRIYEKLESTSATKQEKIEVLPFLQTQTTLLMPSEIKHLRGVVSQLLQACRPFCDLQKQYFQNIRLCLVEAITNAIIHGNLEVDSSLKEDSWEEFNRTVTERESTAPFSERKVKIVSHFNSERILFEIEDEGKGFDHHHLPGLDDIGVLALSGRGLILIRSFMDEVIWNDPGNCITLIKHLSPANPL
ncbi:MAG: response regulator [SAR324 cluster bacterium]|nr:response regulator [SAR324 cluster bacterium]